MQDTHASPISLNLSAASGLSGFLSITRTPSQPRSSRSRLSAKELTRVMYYRHFPVCLLDVDIGSVLIHAENLVVVLPLRLLELHLRIPKLLPQPGILRSGLKHGFIFPDRLLPISGLPKRLRPCLPRLSISRIELQRFVTIRN